MMIGIAATLILQLMAVRLGLSTKKGLGENIKEQIQNPFLNRLAIVLVFTAIVIGNAAYEAGNISGSRLGLNMFVGDLGWSIGGQELQLGGLIIGLLAFVLLFLGTYKVLEKIFLALVIIMSLAFVLTAIMVGPNLADITAGIFRPSMPSGSILVILGLIGTTVVPYNLFLHASLVNERWSNTNDIKSAKVDTWVSICLGGLVSICIIISAAMSGLEEITIASDLAEGLKPVLGSNANIFIAIGLIAAGITSAIAAPLAAAYVAAGLFGWEKNTQSKKFRMVWMSILLIGMLVSISGFNAIYVIKIAQFTNAIVLPFVAIFLVKSMNSKSIPVQYRNSFMQNAIAILVLLFTFILGVKTLFTLFGII
jgi:Mn2+/Fe2+ NRAMP family transporter